MELKEGISGRRKKWKTYIWQATMVKAEWYYSMSICKNNSWSFSNLIVTE
jgi:hypothetical protein